MASWALTDQGRWSQPRLATARSYVRLRAPQDGKGKSRDRSTAFTLIELLVVVSIIALLISILLPSLRRARMQSNAVVCLSQVRQAGTGMAYYVNEFGVFLPHQIRMDEFNPSLPADFRMRWFDLIAVAVAGGDFARGLSTTIQAWEEFKRNNAFFTFMQCPSTTRWDVGRNNSIGYNYKYLGSFRDNTDPANPYRPKERWPVRQVRSPASTIAFADCDGTGWTKDWAPEKPNPGGDHDPLRKGNHGYILDPTYIPKWSPVSKSGSDLEPYAWLNWRTYLSDRHMGRAATILADAHGEMVDPIQAYRDNAMWNGLGMDPGVGPHGTQDESHRFYRLDPHVCYKWEASSGQQWRYPRAAAK